MNIEIKIQSKEEADKGNKLFPELHSDYTQEGYLEKVGVLEGGMESGKTGVSLIVTLDGSDDIVVVQLGAEMLNIINSTVQGAVQRFGK